MKKQISFLVVLFATYSFSLAQSIPNYIPTNGLVGWWPFNGNANDESGNGNNGIVNGAELTDDRFNASVNSYHFNNTGNITVSSIQFQNYVNTGFTISYWYTMEDSVTTNTHSMITNYDGINGVVISYNTVDVLRHMIRTASANPPEINRFVPIQNNYGSWRNAVYIWNPPVLSSYLNGELIGQDINQGINNLGVCCNIVTKFGSQWNNTTPHKGKLDDIGIWNRALTEQEVTNLFNAVNCADNTSISSQTNFLTSGSTATFTATTNDPNPSYIWQSNFGQGYQTLIDVENYSGTNTSTLNISNVQLANHTQPIRVITTSGECVDTSDIATISILDTCLTSINDTTFITVTDTLVINTLITGVNPPNNSNTIKVYPNPANNHITIEYGDFAIMNGYQLKIVNSLGQEVFQTSIIQQSDYLDLISWGGNGLYFVHILDPQENTIDIRKIVLQ